VTRSLLDNLDKDVSTKLFCFAFLCELVEEQLEPEVRREKKIVQNSWSRR
jgi:hypothetical protein